ncbi:MAG: hypothetical protein IPI23_16340 [Bacteroidetes bacterium]|nr:hypothetical protein [Bacteroidota bacterium]
MPLQTDWPGFNTLIFLISVSSMNFGISYIALIFLTGRDPLLVISILNKKYWPESASGFL